MTEPETPILQPGRPGRSGAFFDLDRTLMSGSSGAQFGRAAFRAGLVGRGQVIRWGIDHLRFRLRGATDRDTDALVALVNDLLRGVPERTLRRMLPDLLAGILPRIYPQMVAEVRSHQDAGRPAFIVSAASNGIVEVLARVLDMEGGIGTRYEIDATGRYTGRLVGGLNYGELKIEPIRRFAAEHGIDLASSWAYSDAISDLPMLELVGHPIAVNPDAPLAGVAAERGWPVMRFERLGRTIASGAALALATLVGGGLLARRRIAVRAAGSRR
ncbi:MAG: morphological differentiation-associated protein [Actinomycetes bacterium]|nr:MAG: morphological differentiation-associated protein [Actinomycetes bacterium]